VSKPAPIGLTRAELAAAEREDGVLNCLGLDEGLNKELFRSPAA
jgi:hypothetical protein